MTDMLTTTGNVMKLFSRLDVAGEGKSAIERRARI